ncbi:mitochondrial transcription termination factorfamily protein [Striga asiatica]|uniref:Mitochondrial transcription termination factorfamily protein n=1 Tax=Striga asiatica TaxID=4170 RepID=A0A5A7R3Z8_STRAF|nr:mitochondrial transcription termination factorfamily protein [Striga asiatica]
MSADTRTATACIILGPARFSNPMSLAMKPSPSIANVSYPPTKLLSPTILVLVGPSPRNITDHVVLFTVTRASLTVLYLPDPSFATTTFGRMLLAPAASKSLRRPPLVLPLLRPPAGARNSVSSFAIASPFIVSSRDIFRSFSMFLLASPFMPSKQSMHVSWYVRAPVSQAKIVGRVEQGSESIDGLLEIVNGVVQKLTARLVGASCAWVLGSLLKRGRLADHAFEFLNGCLEACLDEGFWVGGI